MCQLLFSNFKNPRLNRLYMWNQMLLDAKTGNKDGFGVFNGTKVWKSGMDINVVNNLGVCFNVSISSTPTIGHVRAATAVRNNVKTVSEENSHPFATDKLVLAHNGSLEFRDHKDLDKYKDETVDSLIFLKELDSVYDGTNFVVALQQTMNKFYGIFAFLIYSKVEKRWFVIRGKTKKLHYSVITAPHTNTIETSIVINTDKTDLEVGLYRFKALVELAGIANPVTYTIPAIELKEETIYEINTTDNSLIELGEIKEETRPIVSNFLPAATSYGNNYYRNRNHRTNLQTGEKNSTTIDQLEVSDKLYTYLDDLNLSLVEFDSMCYCTIGKGFFYCTIEEINRMIESTYDVIHATLTEVKKKTWSEICGFFVDPMGAYGDKSLLRFPYMMNSEKTLLGLLEFYNKRYNDLSETTDLFDM